MRLEYQILAALVLDQIAGDPRWFPHPVRLIGWFAMGCETFFRNFLKAPRLAGVLTVAAVLIATVSVTLALLCAASAIHPLLGIAAGIFILYTTVAARDLAGHSRKVYRALKANDIELARKQVGMIVGRDTDSLNEEEITKAAIESVAENIVDGVTAPLFFAVLGGPIGAMLYKAINTMDSMFGYKNDRYLEFGWAAARLDDLANFIPARITGLLVPLAAFFLNLSSAQSFAILQRDRFNHTSPNSGHTEAAVAGALGIELGGAHFYFGRLVTKPSIGDSVTPANAGHILSSNRLMLLTSALMTAFFIGIRFFVL